MNTGSFLCPGKITPLILRIVDYKGKTLETETSSVATEMTEMENRKDQTGQQHQRLEVHLNITESGKARGLGE